MHAVCFEEFIFTLSVRCTSVLKMICKLSDIQSSFSVALPASAEHLH